MCLFGIFVLLCFFRFLFARSVTRLECGFVRRSMHYHSTTIELYGSTTTNCMCDVVASSIDIIAVASHAQKTLPASPCGCCWVSSSAIVFFHVPTVFGWLVGWLVFFFFCDAKLQNLIKKY